VQLTASQDFGVISQQAFMDRVGRRVVQVELNPEIQRHVERGDFVISMRSFQGGIEVARESGCISSAYCILMPKPPVNHWYFARLLKCAPYIQALQSTSNLVRDGQAMRFENFTLVDLPVVPPAEQGAIAKFLDRKTATIDALIAKKERLIALLQEKRQALITQAVTKGLDLNVRMKESGVKWIGAIPSHWKIFRTKHAMARIVDCPHETPEVSPDFEYPAVRTSDVDRGRLFLDQAQRVSEATYRERTRRLVPEEGDILYSREGGRFGHAALVPSGVALCLGQRMMMFRARKKDHVPAYFMWVLNADCTFGQVTQETLGSAAPRVNIPTVSNAWVPCPPRGEQAAIAEHIDRTLQRTDALELSVAASAERLREYRQALITAAVTGKIDLSKEAT